MEEVPRASSRARTNDQSASYRFRNFSVIPEEGEVEEETDHEFEPPNDSVSKEVNSIRQNRLRKLQAVAEENGYISDEFLDDPVYHDRDNVQVNNTSQDQQSEPRNIIRRNINGNIIDNENTTGHVNLNLDTSRNESYFGAPNRKPSIVQSKRQKALQEKVYSQEYQGGDNKDHVEPLPDKTPKRKFKIFI